MGKDYIPNSDGEFDSWQKAFIAYVSANAAALGLSPADVASLTSKQILWETDYATNTTAQNAARSACKAKDGSREGLEGTMRSVVRRIQANPTVTDEQRKAMNIPVHDETRTMTTAKAAATRPIGVVDTSERLRHTIRFYDDATPNKRAKPDGVMGCEIWVKLGDPIPLDGSQCQFLALDTASPYVTDYEGKYGGIKAHYLLRWVTSHGDKGPWSEVVSATISG